MADTPKFHDPSFEPSPEQWAELMENVARVVRWESAMGDLGIKILAMGLSPEDMRQRALAWEQEQARSGRPHATSSAPSVRND
jgi:hypothetical protein